MSEVSREKYKVPDGVDVSLAGLTARLVELQPPLGNLMTKATELFDDVYPNAPHPSQAEEPPVVYATSTMNVCPVEGVPMGRELTVVLGAGKWVRVFRNAATSSDAFPRKRLWLWQSEGEASRKVNVIRTHSPTRVDHPYDIETVDYDAKGACVGFVGGGVYYGQEPFVAEADKALDDARKVARDHGYLTP